MHTKALPASIIPGAEAYPEITPRMYPCTSFFTLIVADQAEVYW